MSPREDLFFLSCEKASAAGVPALDQLKPSEIPLEIT